MRAIRVLTALALVLGSFAVATPVAAGDPCFHNMSRPPVSEGTATVVKMDVCAFVPTIVHVPVGTEVQFLNSDVVGHEVVGSNLTWGHHDKVLDSGDRLGVRFAKAGTYPYTCMIHPGMTGAIIVGDASSGAVPPDGAANAPAAGAGAPVQEQADAAAAVPAPASTTSASQGSLPASVVLAIVALAILALVAVLGASLAIRRRRANGMTPTA